MSDLQLSVNGKQHRLSGIDPATPLLWVLRDHLGLVGTKFGCGIAQCGACTVHLDGSPVRACVTPLESAVDKDVTSIEGLARGATLHPLQQTWIDMDVPQCGYCQAGQIMSAAALLQRNPDPDDDAIDRAMAGNYCRCGTYKRIRAAIHAAAEKLAAGENDHEPA